MKHLLYSSKFILLFFAITSCQNIEYKQTKSGIEYRYIKKGEGKKAKEGDIIFFKIKKYFEDSLQYETPSDKFEEVAYHFDSARSRYNLLDIFDFLVEGDSIATRVPMDSLNASNMSKPINYKPGTYARIIVSVSKILSKEEKLEEEKLSQSKQIEMDNQIISNYVKENKLNGTYTENKVFVTITSKGNEEKAIKKGDEIKIYYTGKLLDGTVFDKNIENGKPIRDPLKFKVSSGYVIPGMDEGLLHLNKGSKASIIIPSFLAYGSRGAGNVILPNTVIMFDLEILE